MTDFSSLKMQAELALSKLTEGRHYVLNEINDRFQKTAAVYPQDTVINAMARNIEQLAQKYPGELISQSDIETLYNQLIGLNASGTKFREVLGDLLLSEKYTPTKDNSNFINTNRDTSEDVLSYDLDKNIQAELNQAFSKHQDKYDPHKALAAKKKVEAQLVSFGYNNCKVNIVQGDSKILVFSADVDTNRGKVRVFIPTSAEGTQYPDCFIAGNRIEDLTAPIFASYLANITKTATLPSIQENDIKMPKVETPNDLKAFASEIEENVMEVSVGFPQAAVRLTKKMLVAELDSMGFKGTQIRVAAPTNDGFICEAMINTSNGKSTIEIPIEMHGNTPLFPSVFAKGDYVANFDKASLTAFAMSNIVSSSESISRQVSDVDSMDLGQLSNLIVNAALKGDFDSCNDALTVIGEKYDGETYRRVIADYHKMLLDLEETKNNIKLAYDDRDQFMTTPNSIYPIHIKLGRPVNELIRDENGIYHLKSSYASRKNQKAEGVLFNTAKILIGD